MRGWDMDGLNAPLHGAVASPVFSSRKALHFFLSSHGFRIREMGTFTSTPLRLHEKSNRAISKRS